MRCPNQWALVQRPPRATRNKGLRARVFKPYVPPHCHLHTITATTTIVVEPGSTNGQNQKEEDKEGGQVAVAALRAATRRRLGGSRLSFKSAQLTQELRPYAWSEVGDS